MVIVIWSYRRSDNSSWCYLNGNVGSRARRLKCLDVCKDTSDCRLNVSSLAQNWRLRNFLSQIIKSLNTKSWVALNRQILKTKGRRFERWVLTTQISRSSASCSYWADATTVAFRLLRRLVRRSLFASFLQLSQYLESLLSPLAGFLHREQVNDIVGW
jgi:hypothetical protein